MDNYILGIDIGGTSVKFGVFSLEKYKISEVKKIPTSKEFESFVSQIDKCVKYFTSKYRISKAGIGFPGNISPEGEVLFCPHIKKTVGVNIKSVLKDKLKIEIKIDNDANLAAYAHLFFTDEKPEDLICITVGTGIGGGAVVGGKIFSNSTGLGGEFGHVCVVPGGEKCSCGKRGCVEAYSSSSGMIKRFGKKLKSFLELYDIYKKNDKLAYKIIHEGFYYLGVSVAGFVNIFAPKYVYISGGVAEVFCEFESSFLKGFRENTLDFLVDKVKIKKSPLKEAGILGAVALWL